MNKNVSIIKVDTRKYRIIAQENWGLSKEQMRGMHVHHRIPVCKGGTNDPSNLYVCSPSFHRWCWHDGEEFIEFAAKGAGAANAAMTPEEKTKRGRKGAEAANASMTPKERSANGKKGAKAAHKEKDERGRSKNALKAARKAMNMGVGVTARTPEKMTEDGKKSAYTLWISTVDGFIGNAGNVYQHNRAKGWDPNARVRIT
jgi:hypothetical protein